MPDFIRDIDTRLERWAHGKSLKPLIVRGVRQSGKTAAIRKLGKRHFRAMVELNFERDPSLARIFEESLDPRRIAATIEALFNQRLVEGESLLFLDEIQDCPRALTALRYFAEEMPRLHVVGAGSLLEFALSNVSFPVGRVQFEVLRPMSFREFLAATDRAALVAQLPRVAPAAATVSEIVIQRLRDAMREYWLVGGMPAAVSAYVEERSYAAAAAVHSDLLESFRNDIHKYARGDKLVESIGFLFGRVLSHVGKQITYSKIGEGDDTKRTKAALEKLSRALLITKVRSVDPAGLPLGAEADDSRFKCIFVDIGLAQRAAGVPAAEVLLKDDLLDSYAGRLAEQFVGQQLLAESSEASEAGELYCWIRAAKSSSAEVDYVIARGGQISPVEVKSGATGSLKSMHLFLQSYAGKSATGRGICLRDVLKPSSDGNIDFLPLFAVL